LLEGVASGTTSIESAVDELRLLPYEDVGFAKIDHHRALRDALPEVILALGKTPEQTGAPALFGEAGYTVNERVLARPTIEVNGFLSGFTGVGSKTVLPARAMAKLSMRLVPDQTPAKVRGSLESYLKRAMPASVKWELRDLAHSLPALAARDSQVVQSAVRALEEVWGKRPILGRTGGTIPIVAMIQDILHSDSVLVGFGLPDDNLHAPNEKLHLPTFRRGIEAFIGFLSRYGE